MNDIWRVAITTTDASPPVQIDAVIDHTGETEVVISGQLTPGVVETKHAAIDTLEAFGVFIGYSLFDNCTFGIKTFSLLEKNGVPYGHRVARYLITISPSGYLEDPEKFISFTTSTVSGKARFDSFDTSGNLVSSINATFTGKTISGSVFADDGDPFWGLSPYARKPKPVNHRVRRN